MTLKELVKKVRLELREAVELDNDQSEITSRACLGYAKDLIEKYLKPFERYAGKKKVC